MIFLVTTQITLLPDRAIGGNESPSGFFGIFGGKSRKSSSTVPGQSNQPIVDQIKEEEIS